MLLDDRLLYVLGLGELRGGCEHAVLQLQHLLQGVVEERRGESDGGLAVAVASGRQAHFQLARRFSAALGDVLHLLLHLGLLAVGIC